jgi:hypothetical protein
MLDLWGDMIGLTRPAGVTDLQYRAALICAASGFWPDDPADVVHRTRGSVEKITVNARVSAPEYPPLMPCERCGRGIRVGDPVACSTPTCAAKVCRRCADRDRRCARCVHAPPEELLRPYDGAAAAREFAADGNRKTPVLDRGESWRKRYG